MSAPIDFSSPAGVAAFLRRYNAWRQDQSDIDEAPVVEMPAPRDIGMALDAAVQMLEDVQKSFGDTGDWLAWALNVISNQAPGVVCSHQFAQATMALNIARGKCATCNGQGEIGGFVAGGSPGYVTEECPDCAGAGHAKQQEADHSEPALELVGQAILAAVEAERQAIIKLIPGGDIVDPQWVCDMIRQRGEDNQRKPGVAMDKRVLDPCCGSRMFYFDRQHPDVVFGDQRRETITVTDRSRGNASGTRTLHIEPDVLMDFRDIPYPDGTFKLVSFDPPHLVRAGPKSWLAAKYGKLGPDWREDIRRGFAECFRVLAPDGVLVFKWNENQVKVREVLALTDEKPIFGQVSGRGHMTHWLVFMKPMQPQKCRDGK